MKYFFFNDTYNKILFEFFNFGRFFSFELNYSI